MPELETITENDIAVVELSSFQLLTMGNMKKTPDVAVVTNIEDDHMDHYGLWKISSKHLSNLYRN